MNSTGRFTAALIAYSRRKKAEYYQIMASMSQKPSPSTHEAVQRSVVPWEAPPLTPQERGEAFTRSSIMGKSIILDPKECEFLEDQYR